jgi:hypothetical protein
MSVDRNTNMLNESAAKRNSGIQDSLKENFGLELFKLIYHGVPVETICTALAQFDEKEVGALHRVEAILVDHEARDKRNAALRDKLDDARARVKSLKEAIENLKSGDLEVVLDLHEAAPLEVDGPAGLNPNLVSTGEELVDILEDRLGVLLAFMRRDLE